MRMFFALILIGAAFAFLLYISTHQGRNHDHDLQWIGEQHVLEQEGRALEKQYDFDGAIERYRAAIEFDKKIYGAVEGRPMAFMAEAYQNKHDYETALKLVKRLKAFHAKHQRYIDWEKELQALIQFDQTHSPQVVYDYIDYYEKKMRHIYRRLLTPQQVQICMFQIFFAFMTLLVIMMRVLHLLINA